MAAYGTRGEVIKVLNQMVGEGIITGFNTLHFGKAASGEDPTITVTVAGEPDAASMRALARKIANALEPIAGEVIVMVQQDRSGR